MQRMFICYRRDDSKSVSSRIYDRLAGEFGKTNVFKDVNVIPAGVDFREYLQHEIAKTDTVLVIIGTRWMRILAERATDPTDYVRIEIESAIQQGKSVIPVLVEGARPPLAEGLPETIQQLAYLNTARVDDDPDFHPDMDKLVTLLRQSAIRPRVLPIRLMAALTIVVGLLLGSFVVLQAMGGPNGQSDAQNATATVRALPTLSFDSPTISSLVGMWLYQDPTEGSAIIGSVNNPVPVIGRSSDSSYVLVKANAGRGWIRLNSFMQLTTDKETLPVVSFTAPTPTPGSEVTSTPRPSPTPRPTSEFAAGWLVNASANFSGGLPTGWSVTSDEIVASGPDAAMQLIGRRSPDDRLRRSGYFPNTGARTLFRLVPDSNGFFEASFFFTQGIPAEIGYRYFGLEAVEGTEWRIASTVDDEATVSQAEVRLLPDRVYDLTVLLVNNDTFVVTLIDQESSQRLLDSESFAQNTAWSAKVGDPIYYAINPLAGITLVQRIDTLLLSQ